MSKAVLISIRPMWCEMIANGKKTVEVRKTAPKIKTPFKCYIYCAKFHHGDPDSMINLKGRTSFFMPKSGSVIGEFVCDKILDVFVSGLDSNMKGYPFPGTGMTDLEIVNYLGNGKAGNGWHISDLAIYDEPKKLSDFRRWEEYGTDLRPCQNGLPCDHEVFDYSEDCMACGIDFDGENCPFYKVQRPPQNWCYVEEVDS